MDLFCHENVMNFQFNDRPFFFRYDKRKGGNMMKHMIPLSKQSKKSRKIYYNNRRGGWHEVNPVTHIVPSGKLYRREKERKRLQKAFDENDR